MNSSIHISKVTSSKIKVELLALPVGCVRPVGRHGWGYELLNYTTSVNENYDPEFDKAIRKRQPQWFVGKNGYSRVNKTDHSNPPPIVRREIRGNSAVDPAEKKMEIMTLPVGCKRPPRGRWNLGGFLLSYTSKSKDEYDPEFDKAIRKRQPQWFRDESGIALSKIIYEVTPSDIYCPHSS